MSVNSKHWLHPAICVTFFWVRIKHNRTILTLAEFTGILRIREEKLMCCPEIQQGRHFWFPLCNFLSLCSHRCLHIFMMNHYNCVYDVFEKKTPVTWSWQLMLVPKLLYVGRELLKAGPSCRHVSYLETHSDWTEF